MEHLSSDMVNEYFKKTLLDNFTNLIWVPGHMGAFLSALINIEKNVYPNGYSPILKNKEFDYVDMSLSYFTISTQSQGINKFFALNNLLSKYYKNDELIFRSLYFIFKISYPYFKDKRIFSMKERTLLIDSIEQLNYPKDMILDLVSSEFDYDTSDITMPFIKHHSYHMGSFYKEYGPKKSIFAYFPRNKLWIPKLLLVYKKNHFLVANGQTPTHDKKMLLDGYTRRLAHYKPITVNDSSLYARNFIEINMFDLIINQNITQLLPIDTTFDVLSDKRLKLLNTVKNDILYICQDLYGLDVNDDNVNLISIWDQIWEKGPKALRAHFSNFS